MPNSYFHFKQFTVHQDRCAMKVTTDGCLFGAWCAAMIRNKKMAGTKCIDIGTGTGLLSLMIAQQNAIMIDAIELDMDAALQAKENISSSPFSDSIQVHCADILDWHKDHYDIVVSNPPFYENELKSANAAKNKAHHSDGLLLEELIQKVNLLLQPEGHFYLLLPYKRDKEIHAAFERHNLHINHKVIVTQSTTHPPFRVMLSGSKKQSECKEETLAIRETGQTYTSAFTALMKDYYLKL